MFKAINVIQLQKIAESVKAKYDLTKPTYTVTLAGGGKQIFEYDEQSIQDKATPKTDVEKWEAYQLNFNAMQAEANEKTTAYMFFAGVDCEVSEDWKSLQEWLGIALPDNPFDLKVRYITTELLKTPYDIKNAIAEIMKLSGKGVDTSAVKAAESMFSGTLPA